MTGPLPVKGTEISSAPCSVRKAARLLGRFLSSEAALEVGIARGYVEAVAQSLQEILARGEENSGNGTEERRRLASAGRSSKFFNIEQAPKVPEVEKKSRKDKEVKQKEKDQAMVDFAALLARGEENSGNGTEERRRLASAGRSSKFFNIEQAPKVPEVEKKSRKDKEVKQKENDQAMVDFAALLGHELDGGQIEKQADGELGYEEKPAVTEMLPSTPRQVDSVGDGRESQKSEKHKKKKRKSLGGEAMDVDMVRKAEESDPDNTKSAKKKKKRKSVDGVISNGSPAKEEAGVARAEDEDMKPGDDVRKKKKKKHRDDTSTPMKEESKKVLTEHMNTSIGDRGSNGNDQQQDSSVKKKSKKRSSEVSPGNSQEQHRKSKKLRLSD